MNVKTKTGLTNQDGFASLVIAVVIVLVLSLITVGFAQLMRSEQRSALDKQLASQAYYAAESGVNDATKAINAGYTKDKTECGNGATAIDSNLNGSTYLTDNTVGKSLGATTEASYPCLLINPHPKDLVYDSVDTFTPTIAQFTTTNDANEAVVPDKIEISWQDYGGNQSALPATNGVCDSGKFFPAGSGANKWSYIGLLRFQLTPMNSLTRAGLTSNSLTAFLCPNEGGVGGNQGSIGYSSAIASNSGVVVAGNCNTSHGSYPYMCNATITGMAALTDQTTYFMTLRSIYSKTAVSIKASVGSTQLKLSGAQTVIDSTGKAQDVLKRIQVRVPDRSTFDLPPGTSGLICKQVQAEPSTTPVNACQ